MTLMLTLASIGAAFIAAGIARYVVKPAVLRRRQERARQLAEQVQRARGRAVALTVDLLAARDPDLWDHFVAGHTDRPRGGAS